MRTVSIFIAALCFASIVLNRWVVTDLDVLSFGRVWHLYVTYAEFGFIRRGFVGSVLSETGINSIFSNEYVFAYVIQFIAILLVVLLTASFCIRKNLTDPLFVIGIAFSPAFIIHSGYTTGALDVIILLFALLNILYIRNVFVFSAVVVVGIFTHEFFLFTLPAQFLALHIKYKSDKSALMHAHFIAFASAVAATLCVLMFGEVSLPEAQYRELMRLRIPNAYEQHPLWSGYFEVSSSVERNLKAVHELLMATKDGKILFLIPSLLYAICLTLRACRYMKGSGETVLLIVAVAAPLLACILATDFHRWTAMSANLALLLTLSLASREGNERSKWNAPLALFCLLAPFGSAELERPFPLHQFVLEQFVSF